MPQTCAVQGCTNRSNKAGCENISFHHLPLRARDTQVLKLWVIKAKLPHRLVNKTTRICSAHFVGGKRKHVSDVPDLFPWTPATRKQPPSRNQPPPPPPPRKVPPPACEALLQPSPSPSPLPSESLQLSTSPSIPLRQSPPNPQSADTTSFEGHTRGPKHDHTYCISATQSKLSATSADDRVLHSNTSRALGAASLMMVSTSVQCSLAGKAFSISTRL